MKSQPNNHDGLASYAQYTRKLNLSSSSKPPLCDVIYIYSMIALPAVKNLEEVDISVRDYMLLMQQQKAYDDEIN